MPTKNSINNESGNLTIEPPDSFTDAFIQFDILGSNLFRIGIDDTDDSFKISQGSAFGTPNDSFIMNLDGERTMPLQPAFLAVLESDETNVLAGTHTLGSVTSLTEIFDQGSNLINATFTAPVTGKFRIIVNITIDGDLSSFVTARVTIITSNRSYFCNANRPSTSLDANGDFSFFGYALADMDQSDTATFTVGVTGTAGVGNIKGTPTGTSNVTYISGYLSS